MSYQHQKKKLSDKSNTHYRTWKRGKGWCYSFSVLAALAGGVVLASQTVNADVADTVTTILPDMTSADTDTSEETPAPSIDTPMTDTPSEQSPETSTDEASTKEAASAAVTSVKTAAPVPTATQVTYDFTYLVDQGIITNVNVDWSRPDQDTIDLNTEGAGGGPTRVSFSIAANTILKPGDVINFGRPEYSGYFTGNIFLSGAPYTTPIGVWTPGANTFVLSDDYDSANLKSADFSVSGGGVTSLHSKEDPVYTISWLGKTVTINVIPKDYPGDATTFPGFSSQQYAQSGGGSMNLVVATQNPKYNASVLGLLDGSGTPNYDASVGGTPSGNFVTIWHITAESAKNILADTSFVGQTVSKGPALGPTGITLRRGNPEITDPASSGGGTRNSAAPIASPFAPDTGDAEIISNSTPGTYGLIKNSDGSLTIYLNQGKLQDKLPATEGTIKSEEVFNNDADGIAAAVPIFTNPDYSMSTSYTTSSAQLRFVDPSKSYKVDYTIGRYSSTGDYSATSGPLTAESNPVKGGAEGQSTISVHYQDEDGNPLVNPSTNLATDNHYGWPAGSTLGTPDSDILISAPVIPGYTYKSVSASGDVADSTATNADGTGSVAYPSKGATDVTYIYTANPQKVIYNVIDDTDKTNLETGTIFEEGTSNASLNNTQADFQDIADSYLDQGYDIVGQIDTVPATFDILDDTDGATQVINIHLVHHIDVTGESKTVNEKISYVYEDGTSTGEPDHTDSVSFTRSVTTDQVSAKKDSAYVPDYGVWEVTEGDPTFDAKQSPEIKGYTPDIAEVGETVVTGDSEDIIQTVVYSADPQKIVYTVIDDTTGENKEENIVFDEGNTSGALTRPQEELQAIADGYIDDGYKVEKVDTLPESFDDDAATDQIVYIHLVHDTEDVLESKEVDETIHYVYEDGTEAAEDHTDKVTFTRTNTTDKVTGEVISSTDWIAENDDTAFDAVTSPEIDGYTADKLSVDAVTGLTQDSANTEVTVTYTKDAEEPAPTPEATDDTPTAPSSTPKASISVQPTSQTTKKVLPSTGDEERSTVAAAGGLIVLGAGLLGVIRHLRRKKQ
ncbi:hypothetical protein OfM2_04770 [Lactovum odontotermitis]